MLSYLATEHFPPSLVAKEYKHVWNGVKLLKVFTINITSITLMEVLLHNKEILQILLDLAIKPQKQSWFLPTTDR